METMPGIVSTVYAERPPHKIQGGNRKFKGAILPLLVRLHWATSMKLKSNLKKIRVPCYFLPLDRQRHRTNYRYQYYFCGGRLKNLWGPMDNYVRHHKTNHVVNRQTRVPLNMLASRSHHLATLSPQHQPPPAGALERHVLDLLSHRGTSGQPHQAAR